MRELIKKRGRHARHLRLLPPLFLAILIIAGACDFQLLEPPDVPRWGFSLTIPLINNTYELSELAANDTTITEDTTTNELRIEFSDALDTTSIDSSFLEVELPASATSQFISEPVGGINASELVTLPVEEQVQVVIELDSMLRSSGVPLFYDVYFPADTDFVIPDSIWNTYVASTDLDQEEGPFQVIDTSTAFEDIPFIERMRYLRLGATSYSSKFHTTVQNNNFPTSIDSIRLSLSSGSLLSVIHQENSLAKGATYDDSTDLAAEKLGSEMDFSLSLQLPDAVGDVTVVAGDSAKIAINISMVIGGVDSLAITTAQTSLLPEAPDPLPLPEEIAISSGILRTPPEGSETNTVALQNLVNTLPFDIDFALIFPNISPTGTDSLTFGPYMLANGEVPINETEDMGGYTFRNPAGSGAIEEFEYVVQADVIVGDISIPLDGTPLGSFQVEIEFGDGNNNGKGDLYFDSMTGNFSISFDAVNTTIQNIPTGFAGFQLGRLSLGLLLRNQIQLPVQLDLRLVGRRTFEHDSVTVPINAYVNYPDPGGTGTAPDDITPIPSGNGDTASTLIVIDENSVRTYWLYEGETDTSGAWWSTSVAAGDENIVDVLNLPPDVIEVAGAAVIEGEGVVQAGKGIWGEFEMIAPFAFVLPQDISFLPVAPIALAPMDETTRQQIQTALLSASLTSQARTNFPFGGKISMLASDTTLFTLALDYLDDIAAGYPTAARTGDTTVYATIEEVLEADSIVGIDKIVFYPEEAVVSPQQTKARRVEFYTAAGDSFWIGRLFDMELPSPRAVNELGYVTIPGDTSQDITLDAERVGWIASDTTVYLKSFFTLYGVSGIRTIQSSNWVQFAAYITFDLASDVLGASEEETDSSQVEVTAIANMTLITDSTASVYLDSVFTPPEGTEVKDLELIATTSHAGIATTTVRTERTGGTARKVLRVIAIGPGTARIEVSADDNPQDDIDPVTASFLVTVVQAESESAPPIPLSIHSLIENGQR